MHELGLLTMENRLEEMKTLMETGKQMVLFGAGEKCRGILRFLEKENIVPFCICDNDKAKWGRKYYGYDVVSIESLNETDFFLVLTVAVNNYEEIRKRLDGNIPVFHMCMPFRVDETFLDYGDIVRRKEAYQNVYRNFTDKRSQTLFVKLLNYKLTGDASDLLSELDGNTFFDDELIPDISTHVFVDCGAYTGDTLVRFLMGVGGGYKKIIAIEADDNNCECIEKLVDYGRIENVEIIRKGCWSKRDKKIFYCFDHSGFENGDLDPNSEHDRASVNRVNFDNEKKCKKIIEVDSVDNILREKGYRPTIIKINTVSSDYETLLGCKYVCQKYKPSIIVELGTRPGDIVGIPEILKEFNPEYKIFLRQKRIFKDSKTVLYAI